MEVKPQAPKRMFYVPSPQLLERASLYEGELADLIRNQAARQLCIFKAEEGWMLKVLPTWKPEFYTLIQRNKEVRYYKDLERLMQTVMKHGPLPPTLLLGDNSQ